VHLVTGAGGFLERPLVERLVADGLPVRAMHHREPAAPRLHCASARPESAAHELDGAAPPTAVVLRLWWM